MNGRLSIVNGEKAGEQMADAESERKEKASVWKFNTDCHIIKKADSLLDCTLGV